jgi:histidinol dehydrogenase
MKIIQWNKLDEIGKNAALNRPMSGNKDQIKKSVLEILSKVKSEGDEALKAYSLEFDKVELGSIKVTENEFLLSSKTTSPKKQKMLQDAIDRIQYFHKELLPKSQKIDTNDGVICTKIYRPIQNVGLYVPGGSAPLISTLMMLAIPAQIAKCPIRIVCTPPDKNGKINPLILLAAKLCGVTEVYKVGGAQAIAAMAYGTESIPQVDKIYGPGNSWVTEAKQIISQEDCCVGIDMPAGPSEVLVVADKEANPVFVAADLLAQAEHGPDSQAILVTDNDTLGRQVIIEIEKQIITLSRKTILAESSKQIKVIVTNNIKEAIEVSNQYAPEHLIIQTIDSSKHVEKVTAAGSIFIGAWAPEALGDYVTGSNHVLPTYGYAKNVSGLSTTDFMTSISVQEVSIDGIKNIGPLAMDIANIEGLDAHRNAIKYRLEAIGCADVI